ncbi:LysR family transcriptional regulator [Fodinicola acaciae]|uniref:LysR family transcriptional regulator n=1 Tax=Fodinicola acaciae TaxID=2681555 RepID=UPI0013D2D79B|nr:LysR family transcriptional regulator [Fodinicola acaciae]
MDVEALRTFVAIHRSGGITRAATTLFRSQPAVSRRLTLLEKELGVALFERTAAGVVLSEAGQALLPFAETALAALKDAEDAVHAVRSQASGPLAIALVGTLASTELTPALRRFADEHPAVELRLRTATSSEVSDLVRRADVTIGLRYGSDASPELVCDSLFGERRLMAAAADHHLVGARLALSDLAAERWIAFPEPPGRPEVSARFARQLYDAAGVAERDILRVDSLTAQKRLVEAGFGIALLPLSGMREELAAGTLAVLDVTDLDVSAPVVVVTRAGGYLSTAARTLLRELRALAGPGDAAGVAGVEPLRGDAEG